jgi:hypothetical protein
VLDIFKGKGLHELRLDDVRSLLDDTRAEPLHWEAKGVELKPGEIRKQIFGFANSHDGGYLILSTHISAGKWVVDGLRFPDNDPPAWISSVARGVQPYPEGLDTHTMNVVDDQMVAVVWVPPTPTPPCNAHGTVYERVSGKTESVREPLRLAQLFDRGDGARKRAEVLASQIAQDAISAFGSRNHSEWADRVLFGVGVAAAGYEPDIGSRLFTQRFWHDVEKLVPTPRGPIQPKDVFPEHRHDAVVGSTGERRQLHEPEWRVVASWTGAVGTACAMFDAKSPHIPSLVGDMRTAWSIASDAMRQLGPLGAVYMAIHVAHGGGAVEVGELKRGPIELAVADELLPGIERELMRLGRRIAFEDG